MKNLKLIGIAAIAVMGLNVTVFGACYVANGNGCQTFNRCGLFQAGDKCVVGAHGSTVGAQTCESQGVTAAMGVTCGDYSVRGPSGPCTAGSAAGCGGPYPAPCSI